LINYDTNNWERLLNCQVDIAKVDILKEHIRDRVLSLIVSWEKEIILSANTSYLNKKLLLVYTKN